MSRGRAELLLRSKIVLYSGHVREVVIWKVPISEYFPAGVKYRLVLADPVWKKVLLLFDNHAPKRHHVHMINGQEHNYYFSSVKNLIEDFLLMEDKLEKDYENNEN
ncbi:DUF6516 family protein [Bacteriovorax sp. PP10]|uniref:DUF6516 family protein n=1 Tax=Bacteriovorax antarcticus TaxID=3088717 RepID=A0ABU5VUB6_9BACT|nr:DUF6516 family protein [Bacteriovorax sp. PP10]MEA9356651.1 DUF6516 family protein [Bacteriovorax sp. PP10]